MTDTVSTADGGSGGSSFPSDSSGGSWGGGDSGGGSPGDFDPGGGHDNQRAGQPSGRGAQDQQDGGGDLDAELAAEALDWAREQHRRRKERRKKKGRRGLLGRMVVWLLFVAALTFILLLVFLLCLPVLFSLFVVSAIAAVLGGGPEPTATALADIPAPLLAIYQQAVTDCDGLEWNVLAAIAKIESNHGRHGGATVGPDGKVFPPIIGPRLDGSGGTAVIRDTDDGDLDGDTSYDRAVGPFQFIPSSWEIFGRDGNGDGVKDPQNFHDAAPAAVAHLCPSGTMPNVRDALYGYNHSWDYVDKVLAKAEEYGQAGLQIGATVEGYALPAAGLERWMVIKPHHDYPASDLPIAAGTPVFAMVAGTVVTANGNAGYYGGGGSGKCGNTIIISGIDGASYTYCHLRRVTVSAGQSVTGGQQIGLSGGVPGEPGAGNTTGAHLHLGMKVGGVTICPQDVMVGIMDGNPIDPSSARRSGCSN